MDQRGGRRMKCDFYLKPMGKDETGIFLIDEQRGGHIECGHKRLNEKLQQTTLFKNKKPTKFHLDAYDEW